MGIVVAWSPPTTMGTAPRVRISLITAVAIRPLSSYSAGDLEDVAAIGEADPASGEDLAAEVPVVVPKEVRIAHRRLPDRTGGPAGRLA